MGFHEKTDIYRLHDWMAGEPEAQGARIGAFEYGPSHPYGCIERYLRVSERRMAQPGMTIDLLNKFPGDASGGPSTFEAAHAAGLPGRDGILRDFILPLLRNG
ncbi:hypothetical protein [Bradyrhizobium ottawaense]|uniref:Uncharacterized protein n=1 Tax=Bradyrhizobium ottawaense TaxID=931866 RepID=A0ABV4G5I4_9BRAD